MKKYLSCLVIISVAGYSFAGNPDRAGSAGAGELLINPWARSSGWAGANMASVRGLESQLLNIAGMAFTTKTEVLFAHTSLLRAADIGIFALGFSQRVGETSVVGVGLMSMSFGDIERTTVELPEGGLGTFSPNYSNLGLSFAKEFSRSIYGGITVKGISQSIADVGLTNVAFDMGIQYVTGLTKKSKDNLKFGIALKNVGPSMAYSGDGMVFKQTISSNSVEMTVSQRSANMELPSSMNVGLTYDVYAGGDDSIGIAPMHKVTFAGTFTSNSFTYDQYLIGAEYSYKSMLMLRAGFVYEENVFDRITRSTFFTGPTAGFTFEVPLSQKEGKKSTFAVDYSYRATNPFSGVHSIGVRFNL